MDSGGKIHSQKSFSFSSSVQPQTKVAKTSECFCSRFTISILAKGFCFSEMIPLFLTTEQLIPATATGGTKPTGHKSADTIQKRYCLKIKYK